MSRAGIQRRRFSFTTGYGFPIPTVSIDSMMLVTPPMVFKREKKRVPSVVAECPFSRRGTRRTTCDGMSPVASGIAVPTSAINSDTEPGGPVLTSEGRAAPSAVGQGSSRPAPLALLGRHIPAGGQSAGRHRRSDESPQRRHGGTLRAHRVRLSVVGSSCLAVFPRPRADAVGPGNPLPRSDRQSSGPASGIGVVCPPDD